MTVPAPPEKRPTLAAIAAAAGVSTATVSKVLNGREDVSAVTRARIQQLLDDWAYVPTQKRRGAPARRTVALLFDDFMSPYAGELIKGITDGDGAQAVDVLVGALAVPPHRAGAGGTWMQRLVDGTCDGAIVVTGDLDADQLFGIQRDGLPAVVIDPVHAPARGVTSIGATNWAGGFLATEHLLGLGHRRIAYLGGPSGAVVSLARLHGYRAAMEKAGLDVDPALVVDGGFTFEAGVELAPALLALPDRPTAIFAVADLTALGVLQAAHAAGIRVPEDLSVVGFDDTYVARWATPALTTVHAPLQDIGRLALRTLQRLMDGEDLDSHHIELATQLTVRRSTAAVAGARGA